MGEEPEFEELEQIPWSALAARTPNPMLRIGWIVAAVLAAAVIGVLVARSLLSGDEGTQVRLPAALAATTTQPGEGLEAGADVVPTVPAPDLYSEADLMAVAPEAEAMLAAMRAEWFVRDYFTVDGDQALADRMTELVGSVSLPHAGTTGASYVEWARAFAVDSAAPGRYAVSVAYRTLASSGDGGFSRNPARAVAVTIAVGTDGAMTIVDLPAPAELPATLPIEDQGAEAATPPDEVVAAALESAGAVGPDPAVLTATHDASGWRVVIAVGDPSGLRWPLAVHIGS